MGPALVTGMQPCMQLCAPCGLEVRLSLLVTAVTCTLPAACTRPRNTREASMSNSRPLAHCSSSLCPQAGISYVIYLQPDKQLSSSTHIQLRMTQADSKMCELRKGYIKERGRVQTTDIAS